MKYKRIAVITALFVCYAGWAFVYTMHDKYESKAKVHIDTATAIRPLMKGLVIDPDVTAMVKIIQQLMFTRPNLEKIVELSLLNQSKNALSVDSIEKLKKEISMQSSGNKDIYDISYSSDDPEVARSVVQAVLSVFSEQTQGKAQSDASDAHNFIEQQLRDYEIRLQEAEKAKEEFTRNNLNMLMEEDQISVLKTIKQELDKAQTDLQQQLAKKNVLSEQLKQVQDSASKDWVVNSAPQEEEIEDARIKELKDKKANLLIKYTDKHPEVIEINSQIERLQKQIQEQKLHEQPIQGNEPITPEKLSNPYVQTLKSAYDNAEAEVASSQALVDALMDKINRLDEGLKDKLKLQTEMKNLNRDYDTISRQYANLLERREQAHITERIDDQTSRLKFKIADPPSKPLKPSFPNRSVFYSVVMVAGFGLGFGISFLMYMSKPVYMSEKQVRDITGLPSIGSVSYIRKDSDAKTIDWLFIIIFIMIVMGYFGMMATEIIKK